VGEVGYQCRITATSNRDSKGRTQDVHSGTEANNSNPVGGGSRAFMGGIGCHSGWDSYFSFSARCRLLRLVHLREEEGEEDITDHTNIESRGRFRARFSLE